MMSGLMLVFMFIAISFMIQIQSDKEKIKEIAITYNKDKKELYKDLYKEFSKDLEKWEAEITQDNTIVFNSPEVLFKTGKSMISDEFKIILDEFFPRYIKVLSSIKYKTEIDEIRIEGHTSNGWSNKSKIEDIYLNNMELSQARANNVLSFCYLINKPIISKHRKWLETHLRANGMAFAKLKYKDKEKKIQDKIKSRRVEFKVQLKTEDKIYKILKASS